MSVVDSTSGETISLNQVYSFLMELIPKCGQVNILKGIYVLLEVFK